MPSGTTHAKTPFLAFVSDSASKETLKQFASANGWADSVVHEGDINTSVAFLKDHPTPAVLMVEIATAEEAAAALDRLADVCDPTVKVIVTGNVNEYSFYCWLMDIGISSYLLKPLTIDTLDRALAKTIAPPAAVAAEPKHESSVIALIGTRGGVGTTTIAANLGAIIGSFVKKKTAILDLDPQFGSVAMCFDLDPSRGIKEALEKPDRIDGMFMDRVMIHVKDDLSLLSAEEPFEHVIPALDEAATALMRQMREKFDYVIVDVPRQLTPLTRRILKDADVVIAVSDPSLLSLRDAMRLNDYFRDTLKSKLPLMALNRVGMMGKHEMPRADFEKGLGAPVDFVIPYTADAYATAATGEVMIEKFKQSAASQAIFHIVRKIVPEAAKGKSETKDKNPLGFLLGKRT